MTKQTHNQTHAKLKAKARHPRAAAGGSVALQGKKASADTVARGIVAAVVEQVAAVFEDEEGR